MPEVVVIAHDIRSAHNVGSLLRTCEGLGVSRLYFTGYTPYPVAKNDARLPHISAKLASQINKTSLEAEDTQDWEHIDEIIDLLTELRRQDYLIYALEQTPNSIHLPNFTPPKKIAIILGSEVEGVSQELLNLCVGSLEIPMKGKKESFNVVQATAMLLYHIILM